MKALELILDFMVNHKMVSIILFILILLIIVSIVRKKAPSTKLQFITHILVYIIEVLFVTKLITNFIGTNNDTLLNVFKDYVFAYTLYQLFLLVTFKLKDSLDIDAFTAIKTIIDRIQLYGEYDKKVPEELIKSITEDGQAHGNVFNENQRNELMKIGQLAGFYNKGKISKEEFRFILKDNSLRLDKELKIYSYGWMNSILLRLFK